LYRAALAPRLRHVSESSGLAAVLAVRPFVEVFSVGFLERGPTLLDQGVAFSRSNFQRHGPRRKLGCCAGALFHPTPRSVFSPFFCRSSSQTARHPPASAYAPSRWFFFFRTCCFRGRAASGGFRCFLFPFFCFAALGSGLTFGRSAEFPTGSPRRPSGLRKTFRRRGPLPELGSCRGRMGNFLIRCNFFHRRRPSFLGREVVFRGLVSP